MKDKYSDKNNLALDTWIKLARSHSVVYKKTNEDIRNYGLTLPQFGVIEAIGHLGPLKVGELCKKMLVTGGNMTLVLDNLERNELIERTFSKNDRRAIVINLSEKGKRLFDEIFIQHAEFIGDLFSVLTQNEQKQLGTLLKKLGLGIQNL